MEATEGKFNTGDGSMEGLDYDLDLSSDILFTRLNGATILPNENAKGISLDYSGKKGYDSAWTIKLKQGARLSDVLDRVPFGIINKTITGIGATTLELITQVRDSIIVVPTKSLAYIKYTWAKETYGDNYSIYVGSAIKDITSSVTKNDIKHYINIENNWKKKILVVADSLPLVIDSLQELGINVYSQYFLMIDEIDTLQSDSIYRKNLERVIDYYADFDRKMRCAVTATFNEFSNPFLMNESYVTTIWEEASKRNIKLIYTNYVDDIAKSIICALLRSSNEKILVAYNEIDGILNIIEQLNEYKSECGILCSERSDAKIKEYFPDEEEEIISERGYLSKRIVFMTCAYFAGIDIQDRCHLISISSHLQHFTLLSTNRLTQIAGRCRNGNVSETIIYSIAPPEKRIIQSESIEKYKERIINKANLYTDFMNSTYQLAKNQTELIPLKEFIESFVDYQANIKIGSDYPTNILRFNKIHEQFTPAYFNIDAVLEKFSLLYSLYDRENHLYEELSQKHNVRFKWQLLKKTKHISEYNSQIRLRDKERLSENIEEAESQLLEWLKNPNMEILENLCKNSNKKIETYFNTFKALYPYIEPVRLLKDLKKVSKDKRELRNYVNAAVFFALAPSNPFKAYVLAKFRYNEMQQHLGRKNIGRITTGEKKSFMREIFTTYFKMTNITDDTLVEYFNCFFKNGRSGKNYKILRLNPKDYPPPIKYIDDKANLFELFVFPNE